MDFSVIQSGGKQYKVSLGQKIKVEKIEAEEGGVVVFETVLLKSAGDALQVGTPFISGVKTEAKVVKQGRGEKKIVFKYHSKTRYRKKKGHRQAYTELEITKI
jgi:large subunit ribosomal protein L21